MTLIITLMFIFKQQRGTETHRIITINSSVLCLGGVWHHGSTAVWISLHTSSHHNNEILYKFCMWTCIFISFGAILCSARERLQICHKPKFCFILIILFI